MQKMDPHTLTEKIKFYGSLLSVDILSTYLKQGRIQPQSNFSHLQGAIHYACRAQELGGGRGVSAGYSLIYKKEFGKLNNKHKQWMPHSAAATGMLIPTLFNYSQYVGSQIFHNRATRMAEWLLEEQLEDGALKSYDGQTNFVPSIFASAEAIKGWVRAYYEVHNNSFLNAALKAGDFLLRHQEKNGVWREDKHNPRVAEEPALPTYSVRCAWALLILAQITKDERFLNSARLNIDLVSRAQEENGWFLSCDPNRVSDPLLLCITDTIRALLEAGILLDEDRYINIARKSADALLERQMDDGYLSGCFDRNWRSSVAWCCPPAIAHAAIIWAKLYVVTAEEKYKAAQIKANRYLKTVQLLDFSSPNLSGGLTACFPANTGYAPYQVLSAGAKFFADALMLEDQTEEQNLDTQTVSYLHVW